MLDSNDNFVEFGTPLEPLEEDEVPSKKPITVADQIAVDEQGRRRFHGAFTGGFSAGYYNTVGSKEGWIPSTFKSSRKDKAKVEQFQAQNVQDFMDDEDLGAFGIAPQIIRPTNEFEQKESRKRSRPPPGSTGPIPGMPVLEQIIQPVKNTVGIKILQRMGWRPGQGIGPRLSKKQRDKSSKSKNKETKSSSEPDADSQEPLLEASHKENEEPSSKMYGCFVPPEIRKKPSQDSGSDDSELEQDLENFTFPPGDIDNILCNPKENSFGLGYTGLDRNTLSFGPVDLFGPSLKSRVDNKKLNIRGEAFGIGVFEDQDEEVYSRADMSQYDFSLETPEERKAKRLKDRKSKNSRESREGNKDVIPGFVRAKNPPPEKKYYPPPYLPKNYVPKHSVRKSRFDDASIQDPENNSMPVKQSTMVTPHLKKVGLDRHVLTIQERQVLLGEQKIPITKAEEEERTKEAEESLKREKAERLSKFAEILQSFNTDKSKTTSSSSTSSRHSFKPFMKNPDKQDRYDKYMALVAAGYEECLQDIQPVEMTEWEREREKLEFQRAKALYKPISTVMSSRFVSAESHDISHIVPSREVIKEKDPTQDPKVAAKMNLFGKLTHKVLEWHPDRLFSRRMNVPHPYAESKMVGIRQVPDLFLKTEPISSQNQNDGQLGCKAGTSTGKPDSDEGKIPHEQGKLKKSLFDNLDFSKPPPGLLPVVPETSKTSDTINLDRLNVEPLGTETEQMQTSSPSSETKTFLQTNAETGMPTRPPIDLFKEIFENSSSEDEGLDSEPEDAVDKTTKLKNNMKSTTFHGNKIEQSSRKSIKPQEENDHWKTLSQSKSDGTKIKGIFDNLDLEKLRDESPQKRKSLIGTRYREVSQSERRRNTSEINTEITSHDEEDIVYGPKPPSSCNNSTMGNKSSSSVIPKPSSNNLNNSFSSSSQTRDSVNSFPSTSFATNPPSSLSSHHKDSDEDEWVEKSHSSDSKTLSAKKKKKKSNSKEKYKESHHSHKSSKTSKKKKKKHSSKNTKSNDKRKKKKSQKSSNSSSSDSESNSTANGNSSSEEESDDGLLGEIKLHQSLTNKKILTKLKELTRVTK